MRFLISVTVFHQTKRNTPWFSSFNYFRFLSERISILPGKITDENILYLILVYSLVSSFSSEANLLLRNLSSAENPFCFCAQITVVKLFHHGTCEYQSQLDIIITESSHFI